MKQNKENGKTPSNLYESINEDRQISTISAWPQTRKLWSNFDENFLGTNFPVTNFGDWKTKIEERSNKVLEGYNSGHHNDNEPINGKLSYSIRIYYT